MTDRADRSPWRRLAELEPPTDARERVRRRIEERLTRSRSRAGWVTLAAVAVAALLVVWAAHPGPAVRQAGRTPAPAAVPEGLREIQAPPDREMTVDVGAAKLHLQKRARIAVRAGVVSVRRGAVDVEGSLIVEGASCRARINGHARVSVATSGLIVRRFAGSVEVAPVSTSCHVLPSEAPPSGPPGAQASHHHAGAGAPSSRPRVRAPKTARTEKPVRKAPGAPTALAASRPLPSRLRDQIRAFRAARTLMGTDDVAALDAWRAMRRRWPDGAFAAEVQVQIVETLVTLNRRDEARIELRALLARYPQNPRAAELAKILK